jgi:hypothetical protein
MDAHLILKKHVEPDNHDFFQIRISDRGVKEVGSDESYNLTLVSCFDQTALINRSLAPGIGIIQILIGSLQYPKHFKRNVDEDSRGYIY